MISCKTYFSWHVLILTLTCTIPSYAVPSSKIKFEQERKALLEKIKTINQILAQTESKRKDNTGQLAALNKKIETNNLLISSLTKEVKVINQQLNQHLKKINTLQDELLQLKDEYAKILFLGAKSMHNINLLVFIFSADSFQTLLQRLHTTKQYAKIRKTHFQEIKKIDIQLRSQRIELEKQIRRKKLLLQSRQREQQELQELKQKQSRIITGLEQQHGKLIKELNQQNAAIKHLDKLISDIVRKELIAKKTSSAEQSNNSISNASNYKQVLSASAKALALQFTQNRGKLPWPVRTGFISNKFGIRMHPVLRNVQVENLGIDIQTQEKSVVHAIFTGVVKTISFVPGMNHVVIIQHGDYHTVYAKLGTIKVKVGQQVEKQEPIGIIYTDKNGVSELQLQIWKGIQKLNPAIWLDKQPA
jgi:septal ring factor EnvC (AmiA/AmiB activator)